MKKVLNSIPEVLELELLNIANKTEPLDLAQECTNFFKSHKNIATSSNLGYFYFGYSLALNNYANHPSLSWIYGRDLCFNPEIEFLDLQSFDQLSVQNGKYYLNFMITLSKSKIYFTQNFYNQSVIWLYDPVLEQSILDKATEDIDYLIDYALPLQCFKIWYEINLSSDLLLDLNLAYPTLPNISEELHNLTIESIETINSDKWIEKHNLLDLNTFISHIQQRQELIHSYYQEQINSIRSRIQIFIGLENSILQNPMIEDTLCDFVNLLLYLNQPQEATIYVQILESNVKNTNLNLSSESPLSLKTITTLIKYYTFTNEYLAALKLYEKACLIYFTGTYTPLEQYYYQRDIAIVLELFNQRNIYIDPKIYQSFIELYQQVKAMDQLNQNLEPLANLHLLKALAIALDFKQKEGNNRLLIDLFNHYLTMVDPPYSDLKFFNL